MEVKNVRGGSWRSLHQDICSKVSVRAESTAQISYLGFRLVKDLPSNKYVLRGGSWFNNPQIARAANRLWDCTTYRNFSSGFRLVKDKK